VGAEAIVIVFRVRILAQNILKGGSPDKLATTIVVPQNVDKIILLFFESHFKVFTANLRAVV